MRRGLAAGPEGLEVALPEAGGGFFPDNRLQEIDPAEEQALPRGKTQDNEIGRHRGQFEARRQSQGIHRQVIPRHRAVDHHGPSRPEIMPVHRQILGVEEQPQVRGPGGYQRPPEIPGLDHGDDRAAPLGHAVGLGSEHRQTQGQGRLR